MPDKPETLDETAPAKARPADARCDETECRLILENLNDTVFMIGSDGRFIFISPNIEKNFGWAPDELLGSHFSEFIHADDLPKVLAAFSKVLEGEYSPQEYRVKKKDGSFTFIRSSSRVIRRDDRTVGLTGILTDITEEKKTEAALRESEQDLQEAQRLGRIGSWKVDLSTGRYTWSKEYYRIIGLDPGELEADHDAYFRMIPAEDAPAHLERMLLLFSEGIPYAAEHRIVLKTGESRWLMSRAGIVRDYRGRPLSCQGTIADITDRKLAEMSLKANEERLREFFIYANDIIFTADLNGNFISVNPVIEKILGYRPEEFVGKHMSAVASAETVRLADENIRLKLNHQVDNTTYMAEVRARDGSKHFLEISSTLRLKDGKPFEVFAIARDITDRKRADEERARLEEQLRQAQKMESVGRLAGGVAHDFNNLLTGIIGNINLTVGELGDGNPLSEHLKEAEKTAESAAGLIRRLLAFSRKQIIEPRVVNLNDLIGNIHKMLQRLIGEDILLEFSPRADLWSVRTDPGQIEQVIVNLLVNSRDAMPDGGRIRLETDNVRLDENYCRSHHPAVPGEYVSLVVTDNGTGMSAEVKSHLFEPFFTTKKKGKGTGLGLATVYGAVHQNNGHVDVWSEPGAGTTFTVYLPRTSDEIVREPQKKAGAEPLGGHETILVVEDEQSVCDLAVRVLKKRGYTVLAFPDGDAALAGAGVYNGEIHLLLTDVVMPGMDGKELSERLRDGRPGIRVLFTSGYTEDVIVHHGILEEGIHFLAKPYDPQSLASKVREVLDG